MSSVNSKVSWMSAKGSSSARRCLGSILYHKYTEVAIGITTILNFGLIVHDADLQADGHAAPVWLEVSSMMCFSVYCVELAIRVYVERLRIFENSWNWLDMAVVALGTIEQILRAAGVTFVSISFLRVFRCFRLIRIFKALYLLSAFKELQMLIRGCVACMRTLLWSVLLIFVIMTAWSVIAVELVNPLMKSVKEGKSQWEQCERCERSFASVMASNLTFFQTMVAGDSWGKVAVPTIEMYPFTALLFMGALFSLVVGILNLIVAVLVDSAAEARARDTESRAREADEQALKEKKVLEKIFKKIDVDSNGELTYEELQRGAQEIPEFRDRLKVMGIDDGDLHQMFLMCDQDASGEIDLEEFIEALYRMKFSDHNVAATFVKHYIHLMDKNHRLLADRVEEIFSMIKRSQLSSWQNLPDLPESRKAVIDTDGTQTAENFCGEWTAVTQRTRSQPHSHSSLSALRRQPSYRSQRSFFSLPSEQSSDNLILPEETASQVLAAPNRLILKAVPPLAAKQVYIENASSGIADVKCLDDQARMETAQSILVEPNISVLRLISSPRTPVCTSPSCATPLGTPRPTLPPRLSAHDEELMAFEKAVVDEHKGCGWGSEATKSSGV